MQERRNENIQYMAGISKESVRIYPPLSFELKTQNNDSTKLRTMKLYIEPNRADNKEITKT
jgi:hypothetical protein